MAETGGKDDKLIKEDKTHKTPTSFTSFDDDPYFITSHDFVNPAKDFVSEPLNTTNYHVWSRSILRALEVRNKVGFVTGSLKALDPDKPRYPAWKRLNSLLVSWLPSGCDSKIINVGTLETTAHAFWEEFKKKYFPRNGTRLLELKLEQMSLIQGSLSILDSYNNLEVISQELNHHQ